MPKTTISTRLAYSDPSLLCLIVDVTPSEWQDRNNIRRVMDVKGRHGPASFPEYLSSILAYCNAFASLNRSNSLVVIAVAGDDVAVVYPRVGSDIDDPVDARILHDSVTLGVSELVSRNASRVALIPRRPDAGAGAGGDGSRPYRKEAAMAAAFSMGLCVINRYLVSAGVGTTALRYTSATANSEGAGGGGDASNGGDKNKKGGKDEKGGGNSILASMISGGNGDDKGSAPRRGPSPRILVLQVTGDCSKDYNAFMNATFASMKQDVVVDGCYLRKPPGKQPTQSPSTSVFLEQACDLTKGVFLNATPPTQSTGGLLEMLITAFLPAQNTRHGMELPKSKEVNFRARCFQTGVSVDIAFVCNLCLSIFKEKPKEECPTCGATIVTVHTKKKIKSK